MAEEFRVVWRRQGLPKRVKLYQRRDAAERWALLLQGAWATLPVEDPDGYACCDGRECGCRGITNAEERAQAVERYASTPPLVEGPRIDVREVGEWEMALP